MSRPEFAPPAARPRGRPGEATRQLRSAADQAEVLIWVTDASGHFTYLNRSAARFSALAPGATLPDWIARVHPRDRNAYAGMLAAGRRAGQRLRLDYRMQRSDGRYRWLLEQTGPAIGGGYAAWCIDITGARRSTHRPGMPPVAIDENATLLQAIGEGSRDAILVKDRQGRVRFANAAALELLGMPRAKVLGRSWMDLLPENEAQRLLADDLRVMREARTAIVEETFNTNAGPRTLLTTKGPLLDEDGAVAGLFSIATDVTARKQVERTLQEGEKRLKLALDAAQLSTWTLDLTEGTVTIESQLAERFGVEPEERHCPDAWLERLLPEDRGRVRELCRAVLDEPDSRRRGLEVRVRDATGAVRWIEAHALITRDEHGRPQCAYGVCADVSERNIAEQRTAESEKQLLLITDNAPVHIARWDATGRFLFANRTYVRRLGLERQQVVGRTLQEVQGAEALAVLQPYIDQAFQGQRVVFERCLFYPRFGPRFMHVSLAPDLDRQGRVASVIAVLNDVTERRRAEQEVLQREREFKTLAENSPDVILRLDSSLALLYINRAARKALGPKPGSLQLALHESGMQAPAARALTDAAALALQRREEQGFRFTLHDGERRRHYSGRAIPEYDDGRSPDTVLVIVYDVTQEVEAQREREALLAREQAARAQAEAAAHARDQFLAIVSHELRSPLNGIQSWACVLEQQVTSKPPVFERALAGIRTGVAQQVRLIEDLLDATRIISGQLRLSRQAFALRPVIEAALDSVRPAAQAKEVTLNTRFDLAGEKIDGDPDRVQQIVWNLLDNAVKFAPRGGNVWLEAARRDNRVCVTVRDDGRGISRDFLPHLFDRFRQADGSSTRRHDGLGLGLALVRHLVDLHGGEVIADSDGIGQGACFRISLPLVQGSDGPASSLEAVSEELQTQLPSLEHSHILVIDDQAEVRDSLSALLSHAGARVTTAASGAEALTRLKAMKVPGRPQVLICDIAMPDEDGYRTLRRIRDWEAAEGLPADARMPAIALTAFALREDRIRALACGYAMYLTKPVIPAELIVVVARLTHPAAAQVG